MRRIWAETMYDRVYQNEFQNGDVNGDGAVTLADAVALQKWLLGENAIVSAASDLSNDQAVNGLDLALLRQRLLLIEKERKTDES